MVTSIKKGSKLEMRDVIRFLHAKGSFTTRFHDEIVSEYVRMS